MPSPVTPNVFKDLIPRFQSSMCGRFIPTITNFIRRFVDFYEWMFNEDGSFTDDFKTDLCALGCTEVGLCPSLNLAPVMVARAGAVDLTFTVSGPVPYDWELFRATDPAGPWGAAIDTGTGEADSTLAITDSTAVNDTTYYYKLVVSKTDCADVSYITGSVTPTACYVNGNDFELSLVQGVSSITVHLGAAGTTPIPDGTSVKIWRSTVPDSIGSQINTGAFSGGVYDYNDAGLSDTVRYYYTVKVQQSLSCTEFTLPAKNSTVVSVLKLKTPDMDSDNNGIVIYGSGTVKFPDEYFLNENLVVVVVAHNPVNQADVIGQLSDWPYPTTFPNQSLNTTIDRAVLLQPYYDPDSQKYTVNLLQLPLNGTDPQFNTRDYFVGIAILDKTEAYLPSNWRKFTFRTFQGSATVGIAGEAVTLGYVDGWKSFPLVPS